MHRAIEKSQHNNWLRKDELSQTQHMLCFDGWVSIALGSIYQWHKKTDDFLIHEKDRWAVETLYKWIRLSLRNQNHVPFGSQTRHEMHIRVHDGKPRSENGAVPAVWIDLMNVLDKQSPCWCRCLTAISD